MYHARFRAQLLRCPPRFDACMHADPVIQTSDAAYAGLGISCSRELTRSVIEDECVLAIIGFGDGPPALQDPRCIHVALPTLDSKPLFETWRVVEPVRSGTEGIVRFVAGGGLQFGAIEIDETAGGGIAEAAERAYDALMSFSDRSGFTGLLRIWNYADALTLGDGDDERYRLFNVGRARGIRSRIDALPAGTAIGRSDGRRVLQVYWLASRQSGRAIENPRQVSAFNYPRQYGPQSPSFSRAMLPAEPALPLFVSGTASIVGHVSAHRGDLGSQLREIFRNLESLIDVARTHRPHLQPSIGASSLVKVYVRDKGDMSRVQAQLDDLLPAETERSILHGAICRPELMVEVDLVHA